MARSKRRGGGLLSPAAFIRRNSINKGLLGDDRLWRTVFLVISARRVLRKLAGSEPELLAVEKLKPDQTLVIETVHPRRIVRKGRVKRA